LNTDEERAPPIAARKPYSYTLHDITIEDPYHWLKDPGYPEVADEAVLGYLEEENAYFEAWMSPHENLVESLFAEIKARQPQEDESVPYAEHGYLYRWRFEQDAEYRVWERRAANVDRPWEMLLDEPALAGAHDYFRLGALSVSPDANLLAYSTDTDGSERFTLHVVDITSGKAAAAGIPNTLGTPVWDAHSSSFFYTLLNDQWRPFQVRRHTLGSEPAQDEIIYEEVDDSFFVGISSTQSEAYILISTGDHVTNEVRYVPSVRPDAKPQLITERRGGHQYDVDHRGNVFYIRTNRRHENFDLVTAPLIDPSEANWQTFVAGDDVRYLVGHLCLAEHTVIALREAGLDQLEIYRGEEHHRIPFPETTYSVDFGTNAEFDTNVLRLTYTSMVRPNTVFDYDLATRELTTRKVQEVPSGYQSDRYHTHRLNVAVRDGETVPVSIVCPAEHALDGSAPLYLYAYGAYGLSIPPAFSTARLSLLERGFAVAIAHIRGGDDLGYRWYEAGKLTHRNNTFNDFVDVARHLIDRGWTSEGRIAIAGGSAGGELMGAVVNQAPALWGAVAAHVPFVDVLNTMCDTSLPLTPIEWPEWGNPIEDEAAFRLIRSYSPYDQLREECYPPILVTAGLNDPRVTYWEPAKYVARLRTLNRSDAPLLLKTNMGVGHGGKSGRFDSLREVAEEYAFFLSVLSDASD
jgi:oligopeptidase B